MDTIKIITTNEEALGFQQLCQVVEQTGLFVSFPLRYALDRVSERIEKALSTYEDMRQEHLDEYALTGEDGEPVFELGGVRVYQENGQLVDEDGEPVDEGIDKLSYAFEPEAREQFNERHERLLQDLVEIELYLVPERRILEEGAVDTEVLRGMPMRPIRTLFVEGNQAELIRRTEERRDAEAEAG